MTAYSEVYIIYKSPPIHTRSDHALPTAYMPRNTVFPPPGGPLATPSTVPLVQHNPQTFSHTPQAFPGPPAPPQMTPEVIAAVLAHLGSVPRSLAMDTTPVAVPEPVIQPNLEFAAALEQMKARLDSVEHSTRKRAGNSASGEEDDADDESEREREESRQRKKKQRKAKTPKRIISVEIDRLNGPQKAVRTELQVITCIFY
jgi:hypothetical protein